MDSLVTTIGKTREAHPEIAPQELGRSVARVVPRKWRVTVVTAIRAGIPKTDWQAFFQGYIEEQKLRPQVWSRKGKKGENLVPVDEAPDQLDMLEST